MKIIHINEYYRDLGGAERYLFDICNALEEAGHEIVIISSSEKTSIRIQGRKEYFVNQSYGLRSSLKVKGLFEEIIKKENADVIHLHNTQYFISPFIIRYLLKMKPLVKTIHDTRLFCPSFSNKIVPSIDEICNYPMGLQCFKNGCYPFSPDRNSFLWNLHKFLLITYDARITRKIDKLLVSSSYMYDELLRNGFSKENIVVIPLYVDKTTAQEIEVKEDIKKTVLYVGKLNSNKGIMQFIESLSLLKTREWFAEIIGEGEMEEGAKVFVKELGLNDRVRFFGLLSKKELNQHFANCDIVVIPSMIPESFGLVGIEAMAFGKPVVSFDVGGTREWLIKEETGYLVRRGDVEGLALSINKLLENKTIARQMGKRGMERVNEKYRKGVHMDRLIKVYEKVIEKRGRQ